MSELAAGDRELVARYNGGVARIEAALDGITESELDRPSGADQWTARMVTHHLADSETQSYVRLRKLLVEESPAIQGYDEASWAGAAVLGYRTSPIEPSLTVLRAVRAASSRLFEMMTPEDLDRAGVHTQSGAYAVRDWLRIYAEHAEDHAEQIVRARRGGAPSDQQGAT